MTADGMQSELQSERQNERGPDAQEAQLLAVVAAVAEREGLGDHALRKRLGIAMSELNRLLVLLGEDTRLGGLGLVEVRHEATRKDGPLQEALQNERTQKDRTQKDATRRTLHLSEKGRALCRR